MALIVATLAGCMDEAAPSALGTDEAPAAPSADAPVANASDVGEHAHDYWAGRERVILIDQEITVEPESTPFWAMATTYFVREPILGGEFVSPPENVTVLEGTGEIAFTVTWSDATITGMRLTHTNPASSTPGPWIALENGQAATIPVTPDMTDMPHATYSKWLFIVAAAGTPSVAVGTFHVVAELVKTREPVVMPAHPDLWEGRTEITVLDADGATPFGPEAELANAMHPMEPDTHALAPTSPIPMGTRTLHVRATGVAIGVGNPESEIVLRFKTAGDIVFDINEWTGTADGDAWTWTIPVHMDETDNPYAAASDWRFSLRARTLDIETFPMCGEACLDGSVSYHLTVVASQEAMEE